MLLRFRLIMTDCNDMDRLINLWDVVVHKISLLPATVESMIREIAGAIARFAIRVAIFMQGGQCPPY